MILRFGPYTVERDPLNDTELDEVGLSRKFLETYLVPFLEFIVRIRIESPVNGIVIARDGAWKPRCVQWKNDGNIKKLRRASWYLDLPVGSICGTDNRDGYYWPRNAAEFQPTIDQYEGRFFALARTRPHLAACQANADILADQLRGLQTAVVQVNLFPIEARAIHG